MIRVCCTPETHRGTEAWPRSVWAVPVGCTETGGSGVPGRPQDEGLVLVLHDPVRHRRAEHDVLPPADGGGRGSLGGRGPTRFRVRGEARPVRLAPHEAARRDVVAAERPRPRPPTGAGARADPRPATAALGVRHRATRRVPGRGPGLAPDLRWAVELRDPSWPHDEIYAVLPHHRAVLCIHDLLPDHPWSAPPTGPTSASTGRTRSTTSTTAATPAAGCGGRGADGGPGWPRHRRLRLLQQRLRGPRGGGRSLAVGPPSANGLPLMPTASLHPGIAPPCAEALAAAHGDDVVLGVGALGFVDGLGGDA